MAYCLSIIRKKGKRYEYLVEVHREGKKVIKKQPEEIGSLDKGSPPIAKILGEHITQYLILRWNEKGKPRIPNKQQPDIINLEPYLKHPGHVLFREALNFILKPLD